MNQNNQIMLVSQSQLEETRTKQNALTKEIALDAFSQFLGAKRVSHKTINQYYSQINTFFEWCNAKQLIAWQATENDIEDFCASLERLKLAKSTINSRLVTVRRFFAALQRKGYRLDNPAKGVSQTSNNATPSARIKWLSETQIQAMLEESAKNPNNKARNQAAIILMGFCGLRGFEVIHIKRKDIDVLQRSLLIHGKRAKDRSIGFTPKLFAYIQALLATIPNDPETYLFVSQSNRKSQQVHMTVYGLRMMVDELLRKLGFKRARTSSHSLRHGAAMALYHHGVPIEVISKQLGHADLKTTMIYIEVAEIVQNPATSVLDTLLPA